MGARPNSSGRPTGPIATGPRDFSGSTVVDPRDRGPRGFRDPIRTGGRPSRSPRPSRPSRPSRPPRNRVNRPSPPRSFNINEFQRILNDLETVKNRPSRSPAPRQEAPTLSDQLNQPNSIRTLPFPPAPVPPRSNEPTFNRIPGYPYEAIEQFNRM